MPPAKPTTRSPDGTINLEDFWAFLPSHTYIYRPCRETWTVESVNSELPPVLELDGNGQPRKVNGKLVTIKASTWLDRFRHVEQSTWVPGLPEIVQDRYCVDGGWFDHLGGKCLNLYRPPRDVVGDAGKAGPWLDHVAKLYGVEDGRHIICWLAFKVQYPGRKINHALVLGGAMGIGKDLLLAPVRVAVGDWNFHDIQGSDLFQPFQPWVRSVILRLNEAHDLGDVERQINRFALYDRIKLYAAAPPEVLKCNEKYQRTIYVVNVLGLVITTNHKTDGLYLPADDRRHYIAWSPCTREEIDDDYRNRIWHWLEREDGAAHVSAYLRACDLSGFDPYAPPPKTDAFWEIVGANTAPEDSDLGNVLEALEAQNAAQGRPGEGITVADILAAPGGAALEWLLDRRQRRAIPHRLERCSYVACRNPNRGDGRWEIDGSQQTIYVKAKLTRAEQYQAAKTRKDRS